MRSNRSGFVFDSLESRLLLSAVDGLFHIPLTPPEPLSGAVATIGKQVIYISANDGDLVTYHGDSGTWSVSTAPQTLTYPFGYTGLIVGNQILFVTSYTDNTVDIYNAGTGLWSTTESPANLGNSASTSVNGLAMYAGDFSTDVYTYNTATGQWSTTPSLAIGRAGITATTVGNMAIFAGGESEAEVFSNEVDLYDATTGTWSTATLSDPRDQMTVATDGDVAIFAGGIDFMGAGFPYPSNAIDIYNAATNTWTSNTLPIYGVPYAGITFDGLTVFTGSNTWGDEPFFDPTTEIYNALTGQVSKGPPVPSVESSYGAGLVGDDVLTTGYGVAGGAAEVYNVPTATWLTPFANVIGSGSTFADGSTTILDSYSELNYFTVPNLTGHAVQGRRGRLNVTLTNAGSAAIPGPLQIGIYASIGSKLRHGAVLLGTANIDPTLVAGASVADSIPLSLPRSLPGGQYHLIAAAGPPNQLVAFATAPEILSVRPRKVPRSSAPVLGAVFYAAARSSQPATVVPSDNLFIDAVNDDNDVLTTTGRRGESVLD